MTCHDELAERRDDHDHINDDHWNARKDTR